MCTPPSSQVYEPSKLRGWGAEQSPLYTPIPKFALPAQCWATPLGSRGVRVLTVPASLAPQADTGLWKGYCSAVIIHRAGY